MENNSPIYSPDQIMARVEVIKKVRESWKGKSEYLETIDMEIWALTLAATVLQSTRGIISAQALNKGVELPEADRDRLAMQACARVSEIQ